MKNPYQACKGITLDEVKDLPWKKGLFVEEKEDGIWIDVKREGERVRLFSNTGKEKNNEALQPTIEYIERLVKQKLLPGRFEFTGELYFGSQKATTLFERFGSHPIGVYDMLQYGATSYRGVACGERKVELRKALRNIQDAKFFKLTRSEKLVNPKDAIDMFWDIVKTDGEGIVIKDPDKEYIGEDERVDWKIKKVVTKEVFIVGYEETKSAAFKKKGWIGAIIWADLKGGPAVGKCGGMDFEVREFISNNRQHCIGKRFEIGGNEIFKSGAVRHPFFVRWRATKE